MGEALALEARSLHLVPGLEPRFRPAGGGELQPLAPDAEPISRDDLMRMLCRVVDPDHWDRFEQLGEGEVTLSRAPHRPIRMSLFRSQEAWVAVVRL